MSFLYLFSCEEFFLFFRSLASFWWFFIHFLRRTLYNTWKSHDKQLQFPIMIFNKKLLWIFLASPTQKNHHETFWVLYREGLLMNVSKTVCGIVLVLLWFRTIGKTIKTLGFHNNTHLLDQSNLDMSPRGVFRTLSNI